MRRIHLEKIAPISLFIILIIVTVSYFFLKEINSIPKQQDEQLNEQLDEQLDKQLKEQPSKKQGFFVKYKDKDVSHLFPNNTSPKSKITNEQKIKVLNNIGDYFKPELYNSNKYVNSFYKNIDVGKVNDIKEINIDKLKSIMGFDSSRIEIKEEIIGSKESRKVVTILCNIIFSFLACHEDKVIKIPFKNIGSNNVGTKPNLTKEEGSNIVNIINEQQPSLEKEIPYSKLIEIKIEGEKGTPPNYGTLYYESKKLIDLESFWSFESLNQKGLFLKLFGKIIYSNNFTKWKEATKPTYEGKILTWLKKGQLKELLTIEDKLRILNWNEADLVFESKD